MLIRNTRFHLVVKSPFQGVEQAQSLQKIEKRVAVKGSPLFRSPAVDRRVAEMEVNRIVDKHICYVRVFSGRHPSSSP